MKESPHSLRWFGWILIGLGIFLLVQQHWELAWGWGILVGGVILYLVAIRPGGDVGWLFPGTILVCIGIALVILQQDWIKFEYWRMWSILFGALGLGFVISWMTKYSGWWALVPGGAFLFAFGAGMADISWWRYQRVLRQVFDLWPLLLILMGSALVVDFLKLKAKKQNENKIT